MSHICCGYKWRSITTFLKSPFFYLFSLPKVSWQISFSSFVSVSANTFIHPCIRYIWVFFRCQTFDLIWFFCWRLIAIIEYRSSRHYFGGCIWTNVNYFKLPRLHFLYFEKKNAETVPVLEIQSFFSNK